MFKCAKVLAVSYLSIQSCCGQSGLNLEEKYTENELQGKSNQDVAFLFSVLTLRSFFHNVQLSFKKKKNLSQEEYMAHLMVIQ